MMIVFQLKMIMFKSYKKRFLFLNINLKNKNYIYLKSLKNKLRKSFKNNNLMKIKLTIKKWIIEFC